MADRTRYLKAPVVWLAAFGVGASAVFWGAGQASEGLSAAGGSALARMVPVGSWSGAGGLQGGGQDGSQEGGQDESTDPRVVLVLQGGRQIEGTLVDETDTALTLEIGGVRTTFARNQIIEVRAVPDLAARYDELRNAIGDTDADARVLLAEWARDRERYDWAMEQVEIALRVEPLNRRASELRRWLKAQLAMRPGGDGGRENVSGVPGRSSDRVPLLSEAQINVMRIYEYDLRDPVRVTVPNALIDKIIDIYGDDPRVPQGERARRLMQRWRPEQIMRLMFELQARDLYTMVTVEEDPPAIKQFKNEVHATWFQNTCATSRCHGGGQAGRFWLARGGRYRDETVYTNLYILLNYRLADGRPLIDFEDPSASPLLQLALARENSAFPHPQVVTGSRGQRFRAPFQSESESQYRDAMAWIRMMYQPRPEYPLEYELAVPPTYRPAEDGVER